MSHSCGIDPLAIIAQYYPVGSASYTILVRHSMDVAHLAMEVAGRHPELALDKTFVYEAAILHDLGIFLTDAPEIACYGCEPYIKHGLLGAKLLRRLGLPYHALVCERHTASGLSRQEVLHDKLPFPLDRSYEPESLEEKLVCYADCFFSKTHLDEQRSPERVVASMQKRWQKNGYEGKAATVQRFLAMLALFG